MKVTIVLIAFYLLLIRNGVHCFITCPAGGMRICSSNEVPFNLTTSDNMTISNCVYENCPQIVIDSCVGISFNNVTFRNGNGPANLYHGGSISIQGNIYQSKVTIRNCRFENIFSGADGANTYQGGAIYATGMVLVYDTVFVNNSAVDQGGAIMISNSLGFNCTRCVFSGNTASTGGAVSMNQKFLDAPFIGFIDSTLDQNSAVFRYGISVTGGALNFQGKANVFAQNCTISNGYADQLAGGIYATGVISILLKDTTAIGNRAEYSAFLHIDGGAGCKLTVQNCHFSSNLAKFYGGSLRILNGAVILIENSVFLGNTARYGSAIFLSSIPTSNVIHVRNCTFDSENSQMSTLYMETVSLLVEDCVFQNCKANDRGAGIYSDLTGGILNLRNSMFLNLTSGNTGGALDIRHVGSATIQNCSFTRVSATRSGAIFVSLNYEGQLTLNIIDSSFSGNRAVNFGGDIGIEKDSNIGNGNVKGSISGCQFYSPSAEYGGSIYYAGSASVTILNSNFYSNTAVQLGGSIYADVGTTVNIMNTNFYNSQAMTGGSIALISSSGVLNNVSFFGSKASRYGGCINAVGATLSLTNCYSVNSTSLVGGFLNVINEVISISNSIISSSRASFSGGLFSITMTQVTSTNSLFTDSYSENGGSITLSTNSVFQGAGVTFDKSNANFGGCLFVEGNSEMVCDGCIFSNFNAPSNGSLIYLDNGSQAVLSNCQVNTFPGALSGSFIFVRMSSLSMVYMNANYLSSVTGSFLNAIEQSTCSFNNFQLAYPVATGVGGSIIQVEGLSTVTFLNSAIIYPKAEVIFSINSGSNLVLDSCNLTFTGTPLYESLVIPDWYKQINKVVVQVTSDSSFSLSDNSIIDSFSGNNIASIDGTFSCLDSIINNTNTKKSPLFGSGTSQMTLNGCSILNSLLDGAVDQCNFGLGVSSYGGAISSAGLVSIDQGSVLQGNKAHYGGAIAITGTGSLTIGSGVNITDNVALQYGGAFYIDSAGPNMINGGYVFISNNQAPTFPESSLAYFGSGYLDIDPNISPGNLTITGGVYVFNHLVAESISQNSSIINEKTVKIGGRAKKLNFVGGFTSGATIKLTLSQDIPVIKISAINGFNQVATVDPSNLVIVEVNEINQNATLKGETIKSISDQNTGIVAINSLSIPNRSAGLYTLQIRAKAGTLDFDGIDPNPLILNVIYRDCLPGTEQYIASINTCAPIQKINSVIRSSLTIICVILILGCLGTLIGLYHFRTYHLIKANSYIYLSLSVFGCILAFLGPILRSVSCIASTAVENIGFCVIFSSLLIKLYSIRVIFGHSKLLFSKAVVGSLKDSSLAKILYVGLVITIGYEILWGIFGNPAPVPTYISDLGVVISDQCRLDSLFALGMAGVKFIVSIVVSYLAFLNRNVPSDFNEAKHIGFSCYNWVIFGTFLSLTSQFIITNPNVAEMVKGISLIFSHAYTTLYLASYKVYRCWIDPEGAKFRKRTVNASSALSNVSKAKGYIKSGTSFSQSLEETH